MPKKVSEIFSQLSLARSANSHEEVLQIAESILKHKPEDQVALKDKVIALVKLDLYERALPFAEKIHGPDGTLLKSYCLYRLGRNEDLEMIEGSGRGLLHIRAQMAYRRENFEEAFKIYGKLAAGTAQVANEQSDLEVNIRATCANLAWNNKPIPNISDSPQQLVSHEYLFNQACIELAQNRFRSAKVLLDKAKDICQKLDFDSNDMQAELAPINLQISYINQMLGNHSQIMANYDEVLKEKSLDLTTRTILSINKLALQGSENPFLTYRLFERERKMFPDLKLSGFQTWLFQKNDLAVKLQAGRTRLAREKANKFQHSREMVMVATILKMYKSSQAIITLDKILQKEPGNIFVALATIQLKLKYKQRMSAIATMEKLLDALQDEQKYLPGLMGLAVELYDKIGNRKASLALLERARRFWVARDPIQHLDLIRNAGLAKLNQAVSSGNKEEARGIASDFEKIASIAPQDQHTIAGLVSVYSYVDPPLALKYAKELPSVESLTRDINVDELENAGIPSRKPDKRRAEPCMLDSDMKRKKRKPLLPKHFDSSKKIDPERWLPMRERSYYHKSKKGRRNIQGGATQGGPIESPLRATPSVVSGVKSKKKKGRK